jgi:hypothetical protein
MTWKEEWNAASSAERFAFGFVACAAFLNLLLAFFNYPVIGHDAYVHLNWLDQFPRLVSDGIVYPRWLPDSFGGFGAPTFYFYPPLVYWIASIFSFIGIHSTQGLYQLVQVLFSAFSVFTSYALLKQLGGNRIRSLTGALLYSFLTYRFCDVYIRDALTEHAALAFFPIIFYQSKDRFRSITFNAVGWAGLFLTNLPIAYLSVITAAILLIARKNGKEIPWNLLAITIGIGMSAIYLFPAFSLRGLIHQRHLFDLPMHTSTLGFVILDIVHGHFDWLRILSIAVIIGSALLLIQWKRTSTAWKWILIIGIFFQLPFVSAVFWRLIPGMPFVQFSFRWNGMLLLAIAAIFVQSAAATIAPQSKWTSCIFIFLAILTIVSELTISRNMFQRPPLAINSYLNDAPEYAPKWEADDPSEVIGITRRRMSDAPATLLGLTLSGDTITLERKSVTQWNFHVHLNRQTPVRIHQFYWPYWKLWNGSTELALAPDVNGFATADFPAGDYAATLTLERSKIETIGRTVSLCGIIVLLLTISAALYRSITNRRDSTSLPAVTRRI